MLICQTKIFVKLKKGRIFIKKAVSKNYKWVIFSLCFLMVFFCLGFCSTGKIIFLSPITEALNIKRSVFSINDTCRFITSAVVNAFFGYFVTRFGTKKLILGGIITLLASMLINAFATDVFLFYIAGVLSGIGFSWTSTTIVGSIVRRWTNKNVGKIMGVILAANGVGSAVATQTLTPVIYRGNDPFGYRNAYFIIAAILAVLLLLFFVFYKETDKTLLAESRKDNEKTSDWEGVHIKTALKTPCFYVMAVYLFFMGLVLQGMVGSFSAHLNDTGLAVGFAATIVSIYSVMLAVSKILVGFLYDKFGISVTATVCNTAVVGALLLFLFIDNSGLGRTFAVLSAVVFALSLPLETIMLPLFASEFFGLKSYNDILGVFVSVAYAGMAAGVPIMNISYDLTGSYNIGYIISLFVMVACSIIFYIALVLSEKYKNFERK